MVDDLEDDKPQRTGKAKNQIQPGEKRSPGRPKGAKNRKTVVEAAIQAELVDCLESDAKEIYQKAAQMAKDGDKTMLKLFLNRLLPELKVSGEGSEGYSTGHGGVNIIINSTSNEDNSGITIEGSPVVNEDGEEDSQ